jgi:hypothetical protein
LGIFGKARTSKHPLEDTLVWAVPLHIKEGREPLPPPLVGAYVKVFCRADSATLAAWAAIQAIEAMGFTVPESPSTVDQMRARDWEDFVSANWPELIDELPTQAEFYESMADNRAVLGPIAGYEASSP